MYWYNIYSLTNNNWMIILGFLASNHKQSNLRVATITHSWNMLPTVISNRFVCVSESYEQREHVVHALEHGTIMWTGITWKFLYESLLNSAWLWSRTQHAINKKQIFLVTRPPTCWKSDSCFWFVRKDKKRIKANL